MRTVASFLAIALSVPAAAADRPAGPAEDHPLLPVVQVARDRLAMMDAVRDYTCTLVKRERVDGRLLDQEQILLKVRHQQVAGGRVVVPFAVYMRFLAPAAVRGREVLYVEGRNHGKIIARRGGDRFAFVTTAVDPEGELAMQRNRYPITEIGIKNLIQRLLEVAEQDMQYGECEVKYIPGARVGDRISTVVDVTHPVRREHFRYHKARVFIDDGRSLPIRYESYDWPQEEGGKPVLLEEYTYVDLKFNVGLTDRDFDHRNEQYRFRKDFQP